MPRKLLNSSSALLGKNGNCSVCTSALTTSDHHSLTSVFSGTSSSRRRRYSAGQRIDIPPIATDCGVPHSEALIPDVVTLNNLGNSIPQIECFYIADSGDETSSINSRSTVEVLEADTESEEDFSIERVYGEDPCNSAQVQRYLAPPLSPDQDRSDLDRDYFSANADSDHQIPVVNPETQARLEALLEAAGIGQLAGETKQLADPEVLKRLTSSVSCALDEAAAALTRMRNSDPQPEGRSLFDACSEGDIKKIRRLLSEGRASVNDTTEDGESLLSLACSTGYMELAQVLLAMRANPNDRGVKGDCTPLMEASSAGHSEIIRLLLSSGAEVNAHSASGNTPLMYACAAGREDSVGILLFAGANVEDHNENGHTPLMEAASAGHVGVARILLKFGAGINTHSNEFKESALTLACYKGHLEMVRYLLAAGADQEHKTDEMHTALMEASMDGHVEVARLLLDSGAQVNMPTDSFESPLTLAACGGHVELAMLLLERGANIEEVNDEGYTPLMESAREGHEEMVSLLLSQGADINAQTEETQETALTLACCGGFLEVADFLLKTGANIELGASTPLMEAAQEGHLSMVKYLLNSGAMVNAQTGTGDTALTYACENGHTDVADILLFYNAKLEHESEGGRTPLMKAARAGHLCTLQFLIAKGADINRPTTNNDHTPLSLACAGGHIAVVEYLLQQGADPFHKLKDNSTMLIEAAKGGHTNVVQMLLDYPNSLGANHLTPSTMSGNSVETEDSQLLVAPTSVPPMQTTKDPRSVFGPTPTTMRSVLRKSARSSAPLNTSSGSSSDSLAMRNSVIDPGINWIEDSVETHRNNDYQIQTTSLPNTTCSSCNYSNESSKKTHINSSNTLVHETPGHIHHHDHVLHGENAIIIGQQIIVDATSSDASDIPLPFSSSSSDQNDLLSSDINSVDIHASVSNGNSPSSEEFAIQNNVTSTSVATCGPLSQQMLANLLPSERPKVKPSRKMNSNILSVNQPLIPLSGCDTTPFEGSLVFNDVKKKLPYQSKQHNQQLLQLAQLSQLNQQLHQQVLQQRQLKQQNQATLEALQQNAYANKQQLAALQANVTQLQQLEQHIASQQQQNMGNETDQLQQRVQAIMQQKQQLQMQIKQFQLQVERQLAYTQQVASVAPIDSKTEGENANTTNSSGGDLVLQLLENNESAVQLNSTTKKMDALSLSDGLLDDIPRLVPTTSTSVSEDMTPLKQDPSLLNAASCFDETDLALMVEYCPFPLDLNAKALLLDELKDCVSSLQVNPTGHLSSTSGIGVSGGGPQPILDEQSLRSQHYVGGNQQLLQSPNFGAAFGHATLDSSGNISFPPDLTSPYLQGFTHGFLTGGGGSTSPSATADMFATDIINNQSSQLSPTVTPQLGNVVGKKMKLKTQATSSLLNKACATTELLQQHQIIRQLQLQQQDPISLVEDVTTCQGTNNEPACVHHINPPQPQPDAVNMVHLDSETDSNHDTALTLACGGGHEDLVRLLLAKGSDIEHRDKKGFTPLIMSAHAGYEKIVELLIDNGADIEAQSDRTKDTPLSLACSGGRYEVIEVLLSRHANKEHRNVSDYTPLSLAASGGYVNIIKLLLAHGAEINSRTGSKLGISPLMLASMNGHTAAVKLLLDLGSDINAQIETNRNTALTLACFQGRHEVVSLLLDRKANVEHRAKTGLTPLMEAASGGYVEVGRVLLDKCADVNAPPVPSSRDTALTIAADKGHYRFVELLLSRGALVDVRNKKGNSSLWLSANGGHLDVVQLLYSAGADIDSQDNRKVSCLMSAFRRGHTKVVKWMVKHVVQFPSDTELNRFMATVSDMELLKKCHQCVDIIRIAKDRQAAEAAKNATILLEELDRESKAEESKKAAAARRREKKKRRKMEKQGKKMEEESVENDTDAINNNNNSDVDTEVKKEKSSTTNALIKDEEEEEEEEYLAEEAPQSDGGIEDDDVQIVEAPTLIDKKNKKEKNAVEQRAIPEQTKQVVHRDERVPNHTSALSNGVTGAAYNEVQSFSKKRSRRSDRVSATSGDDHQSHHNHRNNYSTPSKKTSGSTSKFGHFNSGGSKDDAATGWKEVVRKSKKVLVPSNAISRVIGRGGCNINAIRELSGAHIEIEKQSKGGQDRAILIKGSADATRQAHSWIQSVITYPEKDLQEIIGLKNFENLNGPQVSSVVPATSKSLGPSFKTTPSACFRKTTDTRKTYDYQSLSKRLSPGGSTKTSKNSINSFASVAGGGEVTNSDLPSQPLPSLPPQKTALQGGMNKSMNYAPFTTFNTFNVNWGGGGGLVMGTPSSTAVALDDYDRPPVDASKAPGYRASPTVTNIIGTSSNNQWNPLESFHKNASTQGRCNSAPGTPLSHVDVNQSHKAIYTPADFYGKIDSTSDVARSVTPDGKSIGFDMDLSNNAVNSAFGVYQPSTDSGVGIIGERTTSSQFLPPSFSSQPFSPNCMYPPPTILPQYHHPESKLNPNAPDFTRMPSEMPINNDNLFQPGGPVLPATANGKLSSFDSADSNENPDLLMTQGISAYMYQFNTGSSAVAAAADNYNPNNHHLSMDQFDTKTSNETGGFVNNYLNSPPPVPSDSRRSDLTFASARPIGCERSNQRKIAPTNQMIAPPPIMRSSTNPWTLYGGAFVSPGVHSAATPSAPTAFDHTINGMEINTNGASFGMSPSPNMGLSPHVTPQKMSMCTVGDVGSSKDNKNTVRRNILSGQLWDKAWVIDQ